ncbi:MAG: AAA family ATPase, partial [Thiohalomonadales bacterium]
MHLKSLSLRNFKSFGDTPQFIDFKPITLLFGPNSAGKSSVVQALLYLYEVLERNNCD